MKAPLGGGARDTESADRAGALLDELDTLIAELDSAIGEQNAARLVIADAETEMAIAVQYLPAPTTILSRS